MPDPDEEWREASVLAGALWVSGALEGTGPEMVEKVKLALRYTRYRRPDDPLAGAELGDQ